MIEEKNWGERIEPPQHVGEPILPCLASLDKTTARPGVAPKRAGGLVTKERLVSKLSAEFACFVHFAIGALMDDLWCALTRP
jgi:hypothetical protein